jgi:hypothetical protein
LIERTFQVRNPEKEIWGGGIEVERYDFAFSGLTEHEDELAMIQLGLCRNHLDTMKASRMASISNNKLALDFLEAYQRSTGGLMK